MNVASLRPPAQFAPAARRGWLRRLRNALVSVDQAVFGPVEPATQRQEVIRRPLVALVIMAVLPIQQMRIPGWPAVVIACGVAIAYNLPLLWLVFKGRRYSAARALGLVLDAIVLMGASLYVFREMGAAGSASEIWLVFVIYVVTGGFTLAPAGSILYTSTWIVWYALATLLYFPSNSIYHEELPVRLVFLGTVGLIALGMARELEKRRARLEVQNRQTLGMLAKLVEARDTDAGAHLRRIQHFSRALALHLGFADSDAEEIAYASMIHDVGKANVPDAILKKPGPLNPREWRLMQEHTLLGDQLLTENSDFAMAREVARWHHEHWDGAGYPDGLAAEEIPLAARIVAVADVFDALISKRPYKQAWPPEGAMREIQRVAGSHLDPAIVKAFLELWEAGEITRIVGQLDEVDEAIEAGPAELAA